MRPMQVTVPELEPPNGQDFWTIAVDGGRPTFTAKVVATVFFGRSKLWIYRQLSAGNDTLDGESLNVPRSSSGQYQFQLGHIERLAHALFSHGTIDLRQFENALVVVKAIASNYRLI